MIRSKSRSVTVGQVGQILDALAPPVLAQSWDNVGLLVGDRQAPCRRILLCIDLTPAVLDEAVKSKCELMVAYHPPLFRPIKRLLADSADTDALILRTIRHGIAVYSPHTALDAAPGGTNDVIAELCGLRQVEPFEYVPVGPSQSKVVTFVPYAQVEPVSAAMFAAGAGRIGDYEQCSYRLRGEGTFFGDESTNPRVGRRGQLEKVAETRLEMVVANRLLPEVIDALLRTHPYEEPAFDIYPLSSVPAFGIGRVGQLPAGTTLRTLARSLQRATRSAVIQIVGPPAGKLRRAAVCVGAAGRLPLEKPRSGSCDVIVTGEIRHHDALTLLRAGKCAIALGHWESERPVLVPLARHLSTTLGAVTTLVSRQDKPPLARL